MKKLIFLLSLCVAGFMQAQTVLVDSTITYDIDGNYASKLEYQYDSLGRQIAAIGYEWVEGVKVGKDYTQTDYDAQGRKVQETVYRWITTTSEYVSDTRTNYTYDGTSNTIVAIVHQAYVADKGRWRYVDMYQYAYVNGRQVLEEHSVMGEDWVSQYKHTWEYAGSNVTLDQVDSLMEATGKVEIYSQTRKEYDAKNREILSVVLSWTGEKTDSVAKSFKEYDEKGNLLLDVVYTGRTNNQWGASGSTKKVYEYRLYGNASKKILDVQYAWDLNFGWKGTSKSQYDYSKSGAQTIETIAYKWTFDTSDFVPNTRTVTLYDESEKNKIDEASYLWKNNGWVGNGTRTTTAYSSNLKTEITKWKWNAAAGEWCASSQTQYTYNAKKLKETEISLTGKDCVLENVKKYIYSYNAINNLQETKITQNWDGEVWINQDFVETSYYDNKLKKVDAKSVWDVDHWRGTERTEYEYTSAGKESKKITYKVDAGVLVYYTKEEHTYNSSNKVTSYIISEWDGMQWIDLQKEIHTYATSGDVTNYFVWNFENGWVQMGGDSAHIEYNAANKMTYSATFKWNSTNQVWDGVEQYVNKYDATGINAVFESYEKGQGQTWEYNYKCYKEYDDNGKPLLQVRYDFANGDSVGNYKYIFDYDASGSIILNERYSWDKAANDWKGESKTVYSSTATSKITTIYSWSSGWYISNQTEVTLDNKGRQIEYVVLKGSENELKYYSKKENRYDDLDRKLVDNQYYWLNEQWTLSSQSEKEYVNNEESRLRWEIRGSWTNGVLNSFAEVHYFYNTDPKLRTIVFKNWNDTVLEQQQLLDGELPEYKGETPTKAADAQYTYTFIGWDRDIEVVTKDTFYTAQFSSTLNKYTIYFVNGEDTLQREQLEYGVMPEYKGETPTKEDTATQYFTFLGWTPDIAEVTEEATYSAEFEAHNKVPTNVEQTEQKVELDLTQPMYNVQGQRVDETYHGIVIQNCRTFLR